MVAFKPVKQLEVTGCGLAASATVVGVDYQQMRDYANSIGIYATDEELFSKTDYVRKLIREFGVEISDTEEPFTCWSGLPDRALLSTKFHIENGKPYWHWVVFERIDGSEYVYDPAPSLDTPIRMDFDNISPEWFIEIYKK